MKVYDYILVFRSSGHQLVNRISKMMLVLAMSVFLFTSTIPFTKASIIPIVITVFIISWWVYVYKQEKKGKAVFFRIALLLAAGGWYIQPKGMIIAIIYLLAALLEKQVKFPMEVAFDDDGVVFNTFPKKFYRWNAFKNVVLKDGLLTIDFQNNKFIQRELDSFPSSEIEIEFNSFCRTRLAP
jgi:hypothetical protein